MYTAGTFLSTKLRAYFKQERGSYDDPGTRVKSARNATRFVEAEIQVRIDSRDLDSALIDVIRDAFMSGQYARAQTLCWEAGRAIQISVTGTEGYVCAPRYALAESKRYMESYLSDTGQDLAEFNAQNGTNFRSEDRANEYLWRTERESGTDYPGLDVLDVEYLGTRRAKGENGKVGRAIGSIERVLVTSSCGYIHDTLREAFPELKPLIAWHLASMKAGAPDQERVARAVYRLAREQRRATLHDEVNEALAHQGLTESQCDEPILVNGESRPARGYKYGSAWVAHWIPDDVLAVAHRMAETQERESAKEHSR